MQYDTVYFFRPKAAGQLNRTEPRSQQVVNEFWRKAASQGTFMRENLMWHSSVATSWDIWRFNRIHQVHGSINVLVQLICCSLSLHELSRRHLDRFSCCTAHSLAQTTTGRGNFWGDVSAHRLSHGSFNRISARLYKQENKKLIRRWDSECELSYYDIFNYTFTQCALEANELGEISKIRAITPFKVIQGHRFWYQSKAHIRLPICD